MEKKPPIKNKPAKKTDAKKGRDIIIEKLLKKIISDFAGPDAEKLVDLLYNKQNVNEFLIAKKMNLTINQTRNMLYKLGDEGLVRFIRKKDKKKGGWYTYFWTLKARKSLEKYKETIEKNLAELEQQLKSREKERYYYSPLADLEYTEEEAILHDYTCPETGEVLEVKDNSKVIEEIKTNIRQLQETIAYLNQEINLIEDKQEKAKDKRIKAEKKAKDEERAKRRVERAKERAKLAKKEKPKKKKPVKKTVKKKLKKKSTSKKKRRK